MQYSLSWNVCQGNCHFELNFLHGLSNDMGNRFHEIFFVTHTLTEKRLKLSLYHWQLTYVLYFICTRCFWTQTMQSCRSKGHNNLHISSSFLWREQSKNPNDMKPCAQKKSTSISTGHDHTSCCPTTLQKHVFPFNWSCSIVCQTCLYGSRS